MSNTILVNKTHKLKESFFKKVNLIQIKDKNNKDTFLEKETYEAYQKLQAFLKKKNIFINIDSAYRSFADQERVYNEIKEEHGKQYADSIVAPIGTSEHHTGLAIDLSLENVLEEDEENVFQELHQYLPEFGFILRYPKGKEEITGYPYEPWHIRYIGNPAATIISKNNYTLEEYLTKYSGILLVNKEKGMTSFDVVNEISHIFGLKRVGHTGTLDPLAEGVLIVALGQATKVVELLTATSKEYIATVKLGIKTDTLDITGKILDEKDVPKELDIESTLQSFKKTYLQEVPIYSAVKVAGKKLYEYARKNEPVTLPKKEVTIKEIELLTKTPDTFTFKALVSKGCYIRSLIADIGKSLNTYATMTELTRTKQGKVSLSQTSTLEDLKTGNYKIYSIAEVLDIKTIIVTEEIERKIKNGQKLSNTYNVADKVLFINKQNNILGIYENKDNTLVVWKNFA